MDYVLIYYVSIFGVCFFGFEVMIDGVVCWVKIGGILMVNSMEIY